eukprot:gb/GEZN01011504.1/.p1 GENE.gb/GEZN01011504.1/~~gb/GEZN01011504.1/.p1  ORF type:complete len:373 (+),score=32.00 gb/GEZN01011504.1/:26-1144(+)
MGPFFKYQWFDAKDKLGNWCEAQIMEVKSQGSEQVMILIHYKGWDPAKYDEWFNIQPSSSDVQRLAPINTHTTPVVPPGDHPSLVLTEGSKIDVLDSIDQWYSAVVKEAKPLPIAGSTEQLLHISYDGYPARWDDHLYSSSYRLAPLHTHTRPLDPIPRPFFKHQWLDVRDSHGQWYEAQVIQVKSDETKQLAIHIHYKGFAKKYDEWVHVQGEESALYRLSSLNSLTLPAAAKYGHPLVLEVGSRVDVLDPMDRWYSAKVKEVQPLPLAGSPEFLVKVSYDGCSPSWDEYLYSSSYRLAPFRSHSKAPLPPFLFPLPPPLCYSSLPLDLIILLHLPPFNLVLLLGLLVFLLLLLFVALLSLPLIILLPKSH